MPVMCVGGVLQGFSKILRHSQSWGFTSLGVLCLYEKAPFLWLLHSQFPPSMIPTSSLILTLKHKLQKWLVRGSF